MKETKKSIKKIFEEKCLKYSDNSDATQEENKMKKHLTNLINQISICLNCMGEMGKSQKNSGTFNNLSVLKEQIKKATTKDGESIEFCSQLKSLSDIGNIVCKKILNDSGRSSGKKLALNSNLRTFDKQAKKWSKELTEWVKRQSIELIKEKSKKYSKKY